MVKIVNECSVDYVNHMGDDLMVVNAARVSFAKFKEVYDNEDSKLIRYLATHNHWSPFAHPQVSLRVKAPIFVARQLGKHQVGLVWNEVSRRYVDDVPEFFEPEIWRDRSKNKKQGSLDTGVSKDVVGAADFYQHALDYYNDLISSGICPEQARMILPQAMMTEWIWTGSLMAWSRVVGLRLDPHTQKETRDVVQKISDLIAPLFPESWAALTADAGTDYRGEVHRLRKLLQENGIKY